MKTIFTLLLTITTTIFCFAQKKDEVLFTINNKPIYVSEFKNVYEKNLDLIDEEARDIDKNLELFIDYKLKVNEAYRLKLDTVQKYKDELRNYRDQLVLPYLKDKNLHEKLLKEAYYRTKNEIRASHILLLVPKDKPSDSLEVIKKLEKARKRVLSGESFDTVAKEISQDPSVKFNGGDLGFFSAFRMIYKFEDVAFNTSVGEVSKPFKTRFGYHIMKVTDKRESKGEFDTAHILVRDTTSAGRTRINKIYSSLQAGENFKELATELSDDKGTKQLGGKLPKFGSGVMVKPFEDAVLSIKKEGDYSKPFKTRFGWHIVKLLKIYPIASFEELKPVLDKKMKKDVRGRLSIEAIIKKLEKEYKITVDQKALAFFKHSHQGKGHDHKEHNHPVKPKEGVTLLTINDRKITQKDFYIFKRARRYSDVSVDELFEEFKNREILDYYKDNLEMSNLGFRNVLKEYKEGLLLFDLLQRKIWDVSNDDKALESFYKKNKSNYKKPLNEIRGEVSTDYQSSLDSSLIKKLRSKNRVDVNKRILKKFKKQYK